MNLYADDYNDYLPYEGSASNPINASFNVNAWYNVLPPYFQQPRLMDLYAAGTPPTPRTKSIFTCPSAKNVTVTPTVGTPYFMYGFNSAMDPNGPCQFKRASLKSPDTTIVMGDASEDQFPTTNGQFAPPRHSASANFVFGDGHAQAISFQDYCRSGNPGCSSTIPWNDSSALGDWAPGVKYHWWPYKDAPQTINSPPDPCP